MSQPYPAIQVIRCPLCRDGATPAHIGNGVIVCECCGAHFRVVHAEKGRTGRKLGEIVSNSVRWKN